MAQFWQFGSGFNNYFNIDHRGSIEGESNSGSINNDYLVKTASFLLVCSIVVTIILVI